MKKADTPTILIIGGTGRMGQWFQSYFKSLSVPVIIYGRTSKQTLSEVIAQADIVMISVPISKTENMIKQVLPHLHREQLLCDIASLKVRSLNAMKDAQSGTVGLHPLFGPSLLSVQGQKIVFCHQHDNDHVTFLKKLFEDSGIEVIEMTAEEHDKQMAMIQALTHSLNIAFAQTLATQKGLQTRLQTPLFTLQSLVTSRVLQQEPHLMADIQLLNPHFLPLIKDLQQYLDTLVKLNEAQNRDQLINGLEKLHKETKKLAPYAITQTNKILGMLEEKPMQLSSLVQTKANRNAVRVAYLGPEGTNTHQAAERIFGNSRYGFLAKEILDDVFLAVLKDEVDFGVVPAENSLHGTVRETLDLLSDSTLQVVGSFTLPIHHCLLSIETDLQRITTVISHPQALAQCKQWLSVHLSNAKKMTATSTTAALREPKKGEAYIASCTASDIYHVPILAKDIEDTRSNSTRFYVISKTEQKIRNLSSENTLLFLTIFNRVGILRDILDAFAKHGISLNKLESRPSHEKIWDYCFYIEVDRPPESKELRKALTELDKYCTSVRVLGRT